MPARRRLRPDEWAGHCSHCDEDGAILTVVKADGRWTLRQLFGSAWQDSDFDVLCRACGNRWPVHGTAMSLPAWLEQIRGPDGGGVA